LAERTSELIKKRTRKQKVKDRQIEKPQREDCGKREWKHLHCERPAVQLWKDVAAVGIGVGMSRSSTLSVLELLHEADSDASNLGRAGLARTNGRAVSLVIRPS
jgi:hypothetical protein